LHATIIKAHSVNNGLVLRKAEQSRLVVAGLGQRSEGTYFDESETEAVEFVDQSCVFIEACRQAHRVFEGDATDGGGQCIVAGAINRPKQRGATGYLAEKAKGGKGEVVDSFRVEQEENRADEKTVDHERPKIRDGL